MDQLEEIKSKIDIVEFISSYLALKKAGRNFKALCPFHTEKTPSLIISPERQIWKCFGCNLSGDVFRFLMEYEKMSFLEALRFLADKTGVKLVSFHPDSGQKERDKLLGLNHLASEFFHYLLLNHPIGKRGLEYLLKRGITKSSIELFKLGYAPNSWIALQNYLIRKKRYEPFDLLKTGLIHKRASGGYYDYFRGRIIFPLLNHRGNVLGFAGRTLLPDLKGAKYINIPETNLYHKGELFYGLFENKNFIKKANKAVVVEGEFDVISSYQAGVKNVVAIKGSALTEPQVNIIKRFCSNLVLALDADLAGDTAVRRGIDIADQAGLNIRVTKPLYGKDPDECARHSPVLWHESVDQSIPVFDFYIKSSLSRFDPKSYEGKKAISEELIPILNNISNEVVKAHYLKETAKALETEEETIIREMERWQKKAKISFKPAQQPMVKKQHEQNRKEKLEELLLSMILQKEDDRQALIDQIDLSYFEIRPIKEILANVKKFLVKNKFNINRFAKTFQPEFMETLDRLYLADLKDLLHDEEVFNKEFVKINKEIIKISLKQQLTKMVLEIRDKEKSGEIEGLTHLREQFTTISKRLKEFSQE